MKALIERQAAAAATAGCAAGRGRRPTVSQYSSVANVGLHTIVRDKESSRADNQVARGGGTEGVVRLAVVLSGCSFSTAADSVD